MDSPVGALEDPEPMVPTHPSLFMVPVNPTQLESPAMQPLAGGTGEPTSNSVVVKGGGEPLPLQESDPIPGDPAKSIFIYIYTYLSWLFQGYSCSFSTWIKSCRKDARKPSFSPKT